MEFPSKIHADLRSKPVFGLDSVRRLEELAVTEQRLAEDTLMENAGAAAARYLLGHYPEISNYVVLAGPGNNGADGLVAARYLFRAGKSVTVDLPDASKRRSALFEQNLGRLELTAGEAVFGKPVHNEQNETGIIDALFGTGFRGNLDEHALAQLSRFSGYRNFAFDCPSGLNGDSGAVSKGTLPAEVTFSFGALKTGYFLNGGPEVCGKIVPIDIGLALQEETPAFRIPDTHLPNPERQEARHKYENGLVYILAGSTGMTGAAMYAAKSAWKGGAGIVKMFVPGGLRDAFETLAPFAVKVSVGTAEDLFFKPEHIPVILDHLAKQPGTVVAGPGTGNRAETRAAFSILIGNAHFPLVLDADGLLAITEKTLFSDRTVLTPHTGELSRLSGKPVGDDFARIQQAKSLRQQTGAVIFSKGNRAVICSPGETFLLDHPTKTYNRAGFGDVLAGRIGCFLAKGFSPADACVFAAHQLHNQSTTISGTAEPEDFL